MAHLGRLFDIIEGYRRSKILFTAVEFGVFDLLDQEPCNAEKLATKIRLKPDTLTSFSLTRLLNACVALDLLTFSNEKYSNNPIASEYLVTTKPDSLVSYVKHNDRVSYLLWSHLDDAFVEGKNRWSQTFPSGVPKSELFDNHYQNETIQENFLNAMHGTMKLFAPKVIEQFDLSHYHTLIDLGGCSGQLTITACLKFPNLNGVIFDLSNVESFNNKFISNPAVSNRIIFKSGDFFKDDLPDGDLYVLGRILHDWSEDKVTQLLKRIYEKLPENGALLIIESLLDDDKTGPISGLLQDLNMLVVTDGFERSENEYRQLLTAIGFHKIDARRTGTCLDIIRAAK